MEFAVTIKDLHEEGKGRWVLAVNSDSVLIAHSEETGHGKDDKSLHWYPLSKCKLVKVKTPEQPTPVVAVQPQKQPKLVRPENGEYGGISRHLRRHPEG